jgi:hypothetical protein
MEFDESLHYVALSNDVAAIKLGKPFDRDCETAEVLE